MRLTGVDEGSLANSHATEFFVLVSVHVRVYDCAATTVCGWPEILAPGTEKKKT